MKKYLFLPCLIIVSVNCFAESVYSLDLTKDIIIGSGSLGLTVLSLFINNSANSASRENFPLSANNINAFDRGLIYEYNKPLDITSDITLYGLIVMPIVPLLINSENANTWLTYSVMYVESLLFVFGTCEIFKNTLLRYRPYCYFGDVPSGKDIDYYKSFPSRHTALAFMSAGFLTSTLFNEYPESPLKLPLSIASYFLAAATGALRIFSGNHFISDVLAGAAFGSIYGYLVPWLHLQNRNKSNAVSFVPLYNGFTFVYRF